MQSAPEFYRQNVKLLARRHQMRLVDISNRIYIFGKEGITTVIAVGPEFPILAENTLWDAETAPKDETLISQETEPQRQRSAAMFASPVQYGVAIVNGSLLIRSGTVLFCVR